MFKNVTNLSYKRKGFKEILGFYLTYFLLGIVLGALVGGLAGAAFAPSGATESTYFNIGARAGTIVSVLYCAVLSLAIVYKKKLTKNIGLILLALVSGLLAFFGGGLLGLIPAAYLSSR